MRRRAVPAEAFVEAWQRGASLADVASATGMTVLSASVRACRYRKLGIPLKRFGGAATPVDVRALTALAKRLAKGRE